MPQVARRSSHESAVLPMQSRHQDGEKESTTSADMTPRVFDAITTTQVDEKDGTTVNDDFEKSSTGQID